MPPDDDETNQDDEYADDVQDRGGPSDENCVKSVDLTGLWRNKDRVRIRKESLDVTYTMDTSGSQRQDSLTYSDDESILADTLNAASTDMEMQSIPLPVLQAKHDVNPMSTVGLRTVFFSMAPLTGSEGACVGPDVVADCSLQGARPSVPAADSLENGSFVVEDLTS